MLHFSNLATQHKIFASNEHKNICYILKLLSEKLSKLHVSNSILDIYKKGNFVNLTSHINLVDAASRYINIINKNRGFIDDK